MRPAAFEAAWLAHAKRQNIVPQNEQTFRHGWNAALKAAEEIAKRGCEEYGCAQYALEDLRKLEVEVQT